MLKHQQTPSTKFNIKNVGQGDSNQKKISNFFFGKPLKDLTNLSKDDESAKKSSPAFVSDIITPIMKIPSEERSSNEDLTYSPKLTNGCDHLEHKSINYSPDTVTASNDDHTTVLSAHGSGSGIDQSPTFSNSSNSILRMFDQVSNDEVIEPSIKPVLLPLYLPTVMKETNWNHYLVCGVTSFPNMSPDFNVIVAQEKPSEPINAWGSYLTKCEAAASGRSMRKFDEVSAEQNHMAKRIGCESLSYGQYLTRGLFITTTQLSGSCPSTDAVTTDVKEKDDLVNMKPVSSPAAPAASIQAAIDAALALNQQNDTNVKKRGRGFTKGNKKSVNEECTEDLNNLNSEYWSGPGSTANTSEANIDASKMLIEKDTQVSKKGSKKATVSKTDDSSDEVVTRTEDGAVDADAALAATLQQREEEEQIEQSGGRAKRARKPVNRFEAGVAVKVSYDAGGWEIAPDKLEYIESKQKKRTNKDKDRADAEHHFDDYFNDMCEDDNEDEYDENGHKIKKPKTSKVGFSGKDKTDPGSVINAMFGGANNLAIINTSDEVMGLLTPEGRVRVQHTVDRMTDLAREMKELERGVDLCDEQLGLEGAITDLLDFALTAPTATSAPTAAVETPSEQNIECVTQPTEAAAAAPLLSAREKESLELHALVNALVARCVQGSTLTLTQLVAHVQSVVRMAHGRVTSSTTAAAGATTEVGDVTTVTCSERLKLVLTELNKFIESATTVTTSEVTVTVTADADSLSAVIGSAVAPTPQANTTYNFIAEKIKCLAERESYRHQAKRQAAYEELEATHCTWRWDVKNLNYFSKGSHGLLREVKSHRNRYRKCIRILSKVVELYMKGYINPLPAAVAASGAVIEEKSCSSETMSAEAVEAAGKLLAAALGVSSAAQTEAMNAEPVVAAIQLSFETESKLNALEEQLSIARLEALKANEARRERERRRLDEHEAKRARQAEKQAAAGATKEPKEAKEKVLTEKEKEKQEKAQKEKERVEKQKSIMGSFFSFKKPTSSSSVTASAGGVTSQTIVSLNENGEVVNEEIVQVASAGATVTTGTAAEGPEGGAGADNEVSVKGRYKNSVPGNMTPYQPPRVIDVGQFERLIGSNMSVGDIIRMNKLRTPLSTRPRGQCRRPKTLAVTVSTPAISGGFGGFSEYHSGGNQQYSETRQVTVDSRLKLLAFQEDTRPPYCGTFSKRSREVKACRPFGRDEEKLNYEYDSEAEWEEEEEEGEDIGMSDGSDDESRESNDNELEYDDMFLHDNDFGSDVGSDGDEMAKVAMRIREGEERIGCRYVMSTLNYTHESVGAPSATDMSALTATGAAGSDMMVFDTSIRTALRFLDGDLVSSTSGSSGGFDNESMRLSSYTAVVYTHALQHIPYLGGAEISQTKDKKPSASASSSQTAAGASNSQSIKSSIMSMVHSTSTAAATTASGVVDVDMVPRDTLTQTQTQSQTQKGEIKQAEHLHGTSQSQSQHHEESILLPLIAFVHGKRDNIDKLCADFVATHQPPALTQAHTPTQQQPPYANVYSKALTKRMIHEVCEKKSSADDYGGARWAVKEEVLARLSKDDSSSHSHKQLKLQLSALEYSSKAIAGSAGKKHSSGPTANSSSSSATNNGINLKALWHHQQQQASQQSSCLSSTSSQQQQATLSLQSADAATAVAATQQYLDLTGSDCDE